MRVNVDADRCQGHGLCASHGPDVFELDDLGYSKAGVRDVPVGLEVQAARGAQACPERAIDLVGSPTGLGESSVGGGGGGRP